MTSYLYTSRSIQPIAGARELLPQMLLDALEGNPVVGKVEIDLHEPNVGDEYYSIDITAFVSANTWDNFSGITAFASADEAWLDALKACGLERTCTRSRMDSRSSHQ